MPRPFQATIIGDSDASPEARNMAENIGAMLARLKITVVTGGMGGIMEAACRGAQRAGGLTIGILPTQNPRDANEYCNVVIPTGFGHARNALTALAGDFIIAIGGGAGTLSEMSFAWMHNKPIFTLRGFGGWSDKLGGTTIDHRRTESVIICETIEELEQKIVTLCKRIQQ